MPAPDTSGLVNELKFWQSPGGRAGLAIRLEELQARAKVDGAAIDVYALAGLVQRLNELGPAERAYVLRQLAAGQPATVTRPPRQGEPSGQPRTQTYFLVQHPLPTPADVVAQQAATAAQMTTTNQATVRAGPSPDSAAGAFTDVFAQAKRRAGYMPPRWMSSGNENTFRTQAGQAAAAGADQAMVPGSDGTAVAQAITGGGGAARGVNPSQFPTNATRAADLTRSVADGSAFFNNPTRSW